MMYSVTVGQSDCLDDFRASARRLLSAEIEPAAVVWTDIGDANLFADPPPAAVSFASLALVPRAFLTMAEAVACHREPMRWSLLYQALWRMTHGERGLTDVASDVLIHRLRRMAAAVKHDQHRMTAFVRFRVLNDELGEHHIAWYEPEHRTLRRTASFFVDRFARLRFSILTPDLTLHWDGSLESFGPGLQKQDMPTTDTTEEHWQRYYSAIFNPARANPRLMASHMPKRYWQNLPEAAAIPDLLSGAAGRTERMVGPSPPTPPDRK